MANCVLSSKKKVFHLHLDNRIEMTNHDHVVVIHRVFFSFFVCFKFFVLIFFLKILCAFE